MDHDVWVKTGCPAHARQLRSLKAALSVEPVDSGDPLAKIRNVLSVESDPRRERPAFQPLFS